MAAIKKIFPFLKILLLFVPSAGFAHPMPSSVVSLVILQQSVEGEAKMPLVELENALGMKTDTSLDVNDTSIRNYMLQHIKALSGGDVWTTSIENIAIINDVDANIGRYQQVVAQFKMTPQHVKDLRQFVFDYDVIVHQVVTHKVLVFVKEDWMNGLHTGNVGQAAGVIKMHFKTGKVEPVYVNLDKGSFLKGFSSMVDLGMEHIKEGTDHLLFLIVLLLPATLVVKSRKWAGPAGAKYSLVRLTKKITAFTIGHSITLLIGASGVFTAPSKIVEVFIAVSILVSAVHALYPIFPGREFYVAGGFGLIHGLAFASVLSHMNLDASMLALSILGFNLGIEMMQLLIILLVIPWMMLLSRTPFYKYFRVAGALFAMVAATGWMLERTLNRSNGVTRLVEAIYPYAWWMVASLALLSLGMYSYHFRNKWPHVKVLPT